uniref:J domain-containing protein n=1 Tax=Populus davidiana TaxID=266767 RepID=A0A6M2EC21_9ROSI
MYTTFAPSPLTAAISVITAAATSNTVQKPILLSPVKTTAGRSRRGFQIKASVSTFPDSTRVDSRYSTLSLYDILRVNPAASQVEIKSAYRSLAKIYHPDAILSHDRDHDDEQSDGGEFIEIHSAYETLSDPAARAVYDLSLSATARCFYRRAAGYSGGHYTTRRWETDQCW